MVYVAVNERLAKFLLENPVPGTIPVELRLNWVQLGLTGFELDSTMFNWVSNRPN